MNAQSSQPPLLETKELSRTFGHGEHAVHAVKDVSFHILPGEIVAVVGESGSGKSTLARLILRLLDSTAGQIFLQGRDVTHLHRSRDLKPYWRKVQGVFQDPFAAVNQFYTNRRVLEKPFQLLDHKPSREEREQRVASALLEVGLDPSDVLDKGPHQLSGGQLQRIMIARALVVGPELLIADEPTSMLDASLRVTVLNLLLDLRERHNMGILFITHDLGQAYYLSDRVLVLYHGELVEQGSCMKVLGSPQHEYTRRLLADVPRLHGWGAVMQPEEMVKTQAGSPLPFQATAVHYRFLEDGARPLRRL
jgi:peptide/nickel transport system ATP-binding protein